MLNQIPHPPHGALLLDNPIWNALSTSHAGFAEGADLAKRCPASVTPLAAMAVPSP